MGNKDLYSSFCQVVSHSETPESSESKQTPTKLRATFQIEHNSQHNFCHEIDGFSHGRCSDI